MESSAPIVGLGEILWDLFPSGPRLGGAPFNFVFHCHRLGHPSVMVSRIGRDDRGAAILAAVREAGLSTAGIQEDPTFPTGTVTVDLDPQGQPSFTINPDVAYDHLAWTESLADLITKARALCFGTLIQRHSAARATVQKALAAAPGALIVYDINLRQHYFSQEVIEFSLQASHWLKLNDDELTRLRQLLGLKATIVGDLLAELAARYRLELICLTRGANGCFIWTPTVTVDLPGLPVEVVDTVGAGDAFTAGLLTAHLEGKPLLQAATRANRLAARVAGAAGGTPRLDLHDLDT